MKKTTDPNTKPAPHCDSCAGDDDSDVASFFDTERLLKTFTPISGLFLLIGFLAHLPSRKAGARSFTFSRSWLGRCLCCAALSAV